MDSDTIAGLVGFVFVVAFWGFIGWSFYRLGKKAGIESAWLAWIPLVNLVVICRLGKHSAWWVLAALVPYVGALVVAGLLLDVPKAFGESGGRRFLILVPLANVVYLWWLAFRAEVPKANAVAAEVASGADDRNPDYERNLKQHFGLDYGKGGWGFEGGKTIDNMVAQFSKADTSWDILKALRAKMPFSQVCVVGGRMVVLVCNTKPQPTCIVTGLTPPSVSDLIATAVLGGAKVSVYRSTWLLTL